jgi:hypothetical protein
MIPQSTCGCDANHEQRDLNATWLSYAEIAPKALLAGFQSSSGRFRPVPGSGYWPVLTPSGLV